MEITKPRDKIACWFETQPGGCKKPHCPFQHQNILDHPREEDIKKKPDLILPVKKEEEKVETEKPDVASVESVRTVILPSCTVEQEIPVFPRQPQFAAITSDPIIVPLQDGESDSESVSGSPQKKGDSGLRLSAQREWELRRLRQIQAHEANLIGYTLEEDQDDQQEKKPVKVEEKDHDPEEFVVEEVVEIEDTNDTAHRRLKPPTNDLRSRLVARSFPNPAGEEDLRHSILKHRGNSKAGDKRPRKRLPVSERLGGVAGRALAETLGTKASLRKPQVKRLTNKDNAESVNAKSVTQRLINQSGDSKSLANRLSSRLGQDSPRGRIPEQGSSPVEKPLASRVGNKRGQQVDTLDDPRTCMKGSPETNIKKRLSKSNSGKGETIDFDFTIKSLADIRAEKQKKSPTKTEQSPDGAKSETRLHLCQARETRSSRSEGEVKVLTLAEIRASKRQASLTTFSGSGAQKREPSPLSLSQNSPKKLKSESKEADSPQSTIFSNNSHSLESPERKTTFSTRKISINRSTVKVPECTSHSLQELSPTKTAEPSATTVQVKKSPVKTSQSHSAVVQEKSLGGNDKANGSVSNPASSLLAATNKHSQVANMKSNPSSHIPAVKRTDSLLDEEEALLLEGDMLELEDVDEEQLLL